MEEGREQKLWPGSTGSCPPRPTRYLLNKLGDGGQERAKRPGKEELKQPARDPSRPPRSKRETTAVRQGRGARHESDQGCFRGPRPAPAPARAPPRAAGGQRVSSVGFRGPHRREASPEPRGTSPCWGPVFLRPQVPSWAPAQSGSEPARQGPASPTTIMQAQKATKIPE